MEQRTFGKTGIQVSPLGLGAANIGYEKVELGVVKRLLDAAYDEGINVIDTAECYGSSEELIGQALGARRQDYFLITKCGHPEGGWKEDYSSESLRRSIERSLRRLKTDPVDAVLLHSCSLEELKKGEAIAALQEARHRGQVRFIGYSGDGSAAQWAVESGCFDLLETSVNVADQEAIESIVPHAAGMGIGVIAKRPIANAAWRLPEPPANAYHRTYWERLKALDYPLLRDPIVAPGIALRFTLSVPNIGTAVVGTTRPERLRKNAQHVHSGPLPAATYDELRRRWRECSAGRWGGEI